MPIEVQMPQMGESVVEGTIAKWLVKEGDIVTEDQPLVEISTDKVDTEIPSPGAGKIAKLVARKGRPCRSARCIALIENAGAGRRRRRSLLLRNPSSGRSRAAAGGSDRRPRRSAEAGSSAEGASVGSSAEATGAAAAAPARPLHGRASTGEYRRWSRGWPRSTASTSRGFPARASAGASANATCRSTSSRCVRAAPPAAPRRRVSGASTQERRRGGIAAAAPAPEAKVVSPIACASGADNRRISSAGLPAARGRRGRGVHAPAQAHR